MTSATKDSFMKNVRMEGRTLVIDGAEFADTREKLEADARKLQGQIWQAGYEHRASDGERHIIELLDRQAAITEANCRTEYEDMRDYLQARIDSLEAERDCGTAEAEPSQVPELDSREKLEADVQQLAFYYAPSPDGFDNSSDEYTLRAKVIKLLDRQAAITEEQTRHKWVTRTAEEIADLKAQLEEVTRAYKERGRIIAELREQLRNDDEPFCETVKRWLSDDAPEECIECEDGHWRDMHELMARECDDCGPMHAAESEIRELQKKYENLLEYRTKVNCDCDCCNWQDERDRMQKVIETQAGSFRKLEAELSSMVKKYEEQKRQLSDKQQENANQRQELARFNAVKRRTKRMPKACVWPRNSEGKLLKPGRDCMSITFYRDHYDVDKGDGEHLWFSYKVAREDERAWMRGED